MLDRLLSMSVFVCAADRRSFAAAAEVFGISPTMVGKHVRFLEERVGAKLLNRTTRQQSLTEVGRLYYERCRQVLADADAADACADEMRAAPRGVLKVHAPVSFGSQRLVPALARYLRRYPGVDVDLTLADRPIDWVEKGYDAAIQIGELADSGFVARELKRYRMWLCAAPVYLAEAGIPQTAADLSAHNCLGFSYWQKKNIWRLSRGELTESVPVKGRLTVNNGQALRTAAIAGLGVIMQPEVLVEDDVATGRLIRLLPDYELPSRPVHLLYLADRRLTLKLRSFVDFVVESLR
ncbi:MULTISPECIES: LysR family transcriptional regulator [Paraburkholderia]|uniref:LysR family transcriptional regulator n=1 Tax=Paraburkholderia TaxID=1822464 RepID=UPI00224F07A9|nr:MULTISPECIES: LysR family transcriptional regulator [Paraburkholderia]MCX4164148.1 LysR family transcriptional regulator [Paraburkholderia megapolitana]MDN7159642.1 LysR family transcriptional regulator [Paraburkholderia sp. CHISQ3]MDQ6496689.1 LysR family transcriptional regulator [Paraburkholderia megapolitana]